MNQQELIKLRKVFQHRINAMLEDGYCIISETDMTHYHFVKLRHIRNNKEVVFHCYPSYNRMHQKTNGRVVYDGIITG